MYFACSGPIQQIYFLPSTWVCCLILKANLACWELNLTREVEEGEFKKLRIIHTTAQLGTVVLANWKAKKTILPSFIRQQFSVLQLVSVYYFWDITKIDNLIQPNCMADRKIQAKIVTIRKENLVTLVMRKPEAKHRHLQFFLWNTGSQKPEVHWDTILIFGSCQRYAKLHMFLRERNSEQSLKRRIMIETVIQSSFLTITKWPLMP